MSTSPHGINRSLPEEKGPIRRDIIQLSAPAKVSMEEQYFDLVDQGHFWAVARFAVLEKLLNRQIQALVNQRVGEIGCGNGLLQRQLEERCGVIADGIELCLPALRQNISRRGKLYYYNVFDRAPAMKAAYDCLFLFDVLEHLADDSTFLDSVLFHLKPGGALVINVPARKELFSRYDLAAGHVRRYTMRTLLSLTGQARLKTKAATYWGIPFYPLLWVRRWLLALTPAQKVYERGFKPPSRLVNAVFKRAARLDWVPQRWIGTSIMGVFEK